MALGENYNVILPFTTSNAIVPSTIVTGALTITGDLNAQRYVALTNGTALTTAFTFTGIGTNTGMFLTATSLSFSVAGTQTMAFLNRSFAGGLTTAALAFGAGTNFNYLTFIPTTAPLLAAYQQDATTPVAIQAGALVIVNATTNLDNGLLIPDKTLGFAFSPDGSPAILFKNSIGTYPALWDVNQGGQYFCKPGLAQFATTNIVPSALRSDAHLTNIASGVTTVFFTLPTTIPGLQYKVSNAHAVANTVVIAPQAAGDTINVFGLTKAAGASVAANAPFSSITLHCITSTQWLATEIMGTWS